jgi:hypothetical protein
MTGLVPVVVDPELVQLDPIISANLTSPTAEKPH